MPLETICLGCGQRIRVGEEHAGKRARCPSCQTVNPVPRSTPIPDPSFSRSSAPGQWTLKTDDGRVFGPVDRNELDRWYDEGRITPSSQLLSSGERRWRSAGEIFPELGVPRPLVSPMPVSGQVFRNDPYGRMSYGSGRTWSQPHDGVLILVLGLIGCLACALTGPVAVVLGHTSLGKIKSGQMDPEGRGLVVAGTVLGWIGTAELAFFGLMFMVSVAH